MENQNPYSYLNYYNTFENYTSGFKNQFLILASFKIKSAIKNTVCDSRFTYTYKNTSNNPVEGIYELPLPFNYSVTGLTVEYDNKIFKGKIKELQVAENKYSDAIASGGQSILAKRQTNGILNVTIGNIEPGKTVIIILDIIGEMESNINDYHYFLHSQLFPRSLIGNIFELDIDIHLSNGFSLIKDLSFVKDQISIQYNDSTQAHVEYHTDKFTTPSTIIISITPKETSFQSEIEFCKDTNTYALSISHYPQIEKVPEDEINQKSEFIFVLDCSGSMSGNPMENSKKALNLLMRSIPVNSKFNIYLFGSRFVKLFEKSELYDNQTLQKATEYISKTSANLGGTNLFEPIQDILHQPNDLEYPRQIFLLTDGEISDKVKLISMVYQFPESRMFTFGIGVSVDKKLVIGISQATRGSYKMVEKNEDIQKSVIELLSLSMEPMFYNIKIQPPKELESGFIDSKSLRPVYNNERLLIYCYIDAEKVNFIKESTYIFTITCEGPRGKEIQFQINLDFNKSIENPNNDLHKIFTLKLSNDINHKNLVEQLSKKHSILTKFNAFIVTIESENPTIDSMITEDINVSKNIVPSNVEYLAAVMNLNIGNITASETLDNLLNQSAELSYHSYTFKKKSLNIKSLTSLGNSLSNTLKSAYDYFTSNSSPSSTSNSNTISNVDDSNNRTGRFNSPTVSTKPTPLNQKETDELLGLLISQNANGSFNKDAVSKYIQNIPQQPEELPETFNDVWTTLIVLSTLIKKYSSSSDQWNLIATKGTKFIKLQLSNSNLIHLYDKLVEISNQAINS